MSNHGPMMVERWSVDGFFNDGFGYFIVKNYGSMVVISMVLLDDSMVNMSYSMMVIYFMVI